MTVPAELAHANSPRSKSASEQKSRPVKQKAPIQLELQLDLFLADAKPEAGPELDPILAVHRAPDSFVTFHVIKNGKLINDCSVKVEALANSFPQFRNELERDAFYSLNAFWRPGQGHGLADLPRALRNSRSARYLNVCFVDVDCKNRSLDFGDLVGRLVSLQDKNVIPPASVVVRSGSGIWLLWILADKSGSHLPPTAHAPRLLLWSAIQAELGRRLAHVGADLGARDVARITRVPGSVNSKVEQRVRYLFPADDYGRPFTHTMEQMAVFLGVEQPVMRDPARSLSKPSARAITGHRALAQHRFDAFMRLRELRGGFREGTRNNAAMIFVNILRACGLDSSTISRELKKFARECSPPLSDDELTSILKRKRTYRMTERTIASRLHVSSEEAVAIPRWSPDLAPASPCPAPVPTSPTERRALILKIVSDSGGWPPVRETAAALRTFGVQVSHVTVSKDYRLLRPSQSLPLLGG